MRLVVIVMTFLLFVGLIGFVMTNLDQKVTVTVWTTEYDKLPLFLLVILAVFAGICYAGIIGVAEGTQIRLSNRVLLREVTRLETEINYLRTQPTPSPRPEPDAVPDAGEVAAPVAGGRPTPPLAPPVAAAPVYGSGEDWEQDEDDDPYSGGAGRMTAGSNPSIVARDHFGWTGPAYRSLLLPGRLTFVRSGSDEMRGAALLTLAIELLSAPRPMPSSDAAVVVYSGVRPVDALKTRLLCHLTHAMPPDPSKLRRARSILADMSAPVVHGDPWLRSQAISEEVRLLAGMWSLAEVADYLRDPGSRSFWPDRARFDAARDLYDRFRDRLVFVDAPRADLPRIADHAHALRASRPIGALLESPWIDPSDPGNAGDGMAAPVSILRRLAEEIDAPAVISVAKRDLAAGSTSGVAPEEGSFHTIDISAGSVVATRTLVLVTLRGSPTGILAFESRSATFRQPLPGEFDDIDLLGPEAEEL